MSVHSFSSLPRLAAFTVALLAAHATQAQESTARVFTNFRLFDGTGAPAVEDAALVVEDGRIVAAGAAATLNLPESAQRIDLGGGFVLPGFINAHGHAAQDTERKLAVSAQYGVTSVFSLGGENANTAALRDAQNPQAPGTARLHIAGPILEGLNSPQAAEQGVESLAALGAEWVKMRVNNGNMRAPVYQALIASAHAHELKVAAHLYTLAEAKDLLRAGIDALAHSVRDQPVDAELLQLMRDNQACLIPTLTREVSTYIYATPPDFFNDPFFLRGASAADIAALSTADTQRRNAAAQARGQADLLMAQRNLKATHDAGLRIALGTDSGASLGRFPGYFEHLELQLMVEAGLTPEQALLAATSVAADCMDLQDTGTLTPGKWADFLVLDADPLEDIRNTQTLKAVFIGGQRLMP
ncbi:MAG: amidohydrolase family protein [Pseudomonadales bacterium]|jgi:imidazolonepropionase-like amidohydrolase|nr:amidohydrolase family protein [Pseudomonadales bacterium]